MDHTVVLRVRACLLAAAVDSTTVTGARVASGSFLRSSVAMTVKLVSFAHRGQLGLPVAHEIKNVSDSLVVKIHMDWFWR